MPAPAVIVSTATSPPPRSAPTDTGPTFLVGVFERGPSGAMSTEDDGFESLTQVKAAYGEIDSRSVTMNWIETYFRNGGNRLYIQRALGDTPVKGTIALAGTSGNTLNVTADQYGAWMNTAYSISVTNGSDGSHRYVKLVAGSTHPTLNAGTVIDQTTNLSTRDDAAGQVLEDSGVEGATFTITTAAGSGLPAVAAATALAGGTDDYTTADATNVTTALALFPDDLGPGQIAVPHWAGTPAVALAALAAAAASAPLRHAVLDSSDVSDTGKGTLTTLAGALQDTTNASHGAFYAPWITVRSVANGGTDRRVPPSALVCARTAAVDAQFHPNRAAAGLKDSAGIAKWATGVGATFSRSPVGSSDADDLSDAGVNLIVNKRGQIVIYDDITLVDPNGDEAEYLHVPNARYRMWTTARAIAIGEGEQFDQINWDTISHFDQRLQGMLKEDFLRGILVADSPNGPFSEAANVDTTTPNTAETMDAGELNANLAVRPARSARFININITAVSLTDSVA